MTLAVLEISHVTYMNGLWLIYVTWLMTLAVLGLPSRSYYACEYARVISHTRMSHVTDTITACHSYEWGMSRIWMSHVILMNESCQAYKHVTHMNASTPRQVEQYGVATINRLLKIIGLFCRIYSLLQGSFAKETYTFKEHTNHSHPIACTHNQKQ